MKLSTKGRYGTRLMIHLAQEYEKKQPVLLREISEKQGISLKYLEQIVILLKNSGLIMSFRGAKGGYILSKPPEKIKLSEILSTLEGNMDIVDCIKYPEICKRVNKCITRELWEMVSEKINKTLSSITLKELSKKRGNGDEI